MENSLRRSKLGLSNKSQELDKLWNNWNKEETSKVVKKQGKFGALDDDETMGNTSKLTKTKLTRFKPHLLYFYGHPIYYARFRALETRKELPNYQIKP